MQDNVDKATIDTPVTRLENQMKHDAGMEGTSEKDPQWRTIASRVVHGHKFDHTGLPSEAALVPCAGTACKGREKNKLSSKCQQARVFSMPLLIFLRLGTPEQTIGAATSLARLEYLHSLRGKP